MIINKMHQVIIQKKKFITTTTRGQSAAIVFRGHSENQTWDIAALFLVQVKVHFYLFISSSLH